MSGDWSDVWWGHSVTSERLSVCQCDSGGIFHDVTKTRMDLEQFSAPSLLIVCVERGKLLVVFSDMTIIKCSW